MAQKYYIIALFVLLGFLIQLFIHSIIEIWYIQLLLRDFEKYSFGLSWSDWYFIHHIGTLILLVLGIAFGFWQGNIWRYKYIKLYKKTTDYEKR